MRIALRWIVRLFFWWLSLQRTFWKAVAVSFTSVGPTNAELCEPQNNYNFNINNVLIHKVNPKLLRWNLVRLWFVNVQTAVVYITLQISHAGQALRQGMLSENLRALHYLETIFIMWQHYLSQPVIPMYRCTELWIPLSCVQLSEVIKSRHRKRSNTFMNLQSNVKFS